MSEKRKYTKSPNKDIDVALDKLMKRIDNEPIDIAVKVINSAVAWEKTKAALQDDEDPFDPDEI